MRMIGLLGLFLFGSVYIYGPRITGKTQALKLKLDPQFEFTVPPNLFVNMEFSDEYGYGIMEAEEMGTLKMVLTNKSVGPAQGLTVKLTSSVFDPALKFGKDVFIREINPGQSQTIQIVIEAGMAMKSAEHRILIDGKLELLHVMGYSINRMYEDLDKLGAKSVTVIMDACFSGSSRASEQYVSNNISGTKGPAISPPNVQPWLTNSAFRVFSSSSMEQTSLGFDASETGLFTYYLALGLQGDADLNQDKVISMAELRKYVSEKVAETSRRIRGVQTPKYYGNDDFIIAEF